MIFARALIPGPETVIFPVRDALPVFGCATKAIVALALPELGARLIIQGTSATTFHPALHEAPILNCKLTEPPTAGTARSVGLRADAHAAS